MLEEQDKLLKQYAGLQLEYVEFEKYMRNIIENLLLENKIKYQSLSSRVKNNGSLKKKLENRDILHDLNGDIKNLRDLCGLRIVLYDNQFITRIINLIYNNFNVINFTNKKFDYNSNNIAVKLKSGYYNGFICEIQIVTLMSHNLIEIGHDIFYKDSDRLEEKDKEEYGNLKEEYKKCLEEVYKLESRIERLKKRKENLLNNYIYYTKIVSDSYIKQLEENQSFSEFYNVCGELQSIVPFLNRNKDAANEIRDKKVISKLVKLYTVINDNDYIFNKEFIFDELNKVLFLYSNIWLDDLDDIINVLTDFLVENKNTRAEKCFFETISKIINEGIRHKNSLFFMRIKNWIISSEEKAEFRAKMANAILKDNIEYAEYTDARTINISRKQVKYNEWGKEIIIEIYKHIFELFLKEQNLNIYNEFVNITYKMDFLVLDGLNYFYNNYLKIYDIYKYDFFNKINYSYKKICEKSNYYKKIKNEKFYNIWKYLINDYCDSRYEKNEITKTNYNADKVIMNYLRNINGVSQTEITRFIKNYNKMVTNRINIPLRFKHFLYEIGIKYNNARSLYKKYKNEYVYLGLRKKGEKVEHNHSAKVLLALQNIENEKVLNEYINSSELRLKYKNQICEIILNPTNKLFLKDKYNKTFFRIIKDCNEKSIPLLFDIYFLSKDFLNHIYANQIEEILDNYYICLQKGKEIIEFDLNLMYIFEVFPDEYRKFFKRIAENKRTRNIELRNIYIYGTENYKNELKENLKLAIELLKKYSYYDIYKVIWGLIKRNDNNIIEHLYNILNIDKSNDTLVAISEIIRESELGIKVWKVDRIIIMNNSEKRVIDNIYLGLLNMGVVSSVYDSNKELSESIKKILKKEKDPKCKEFLKKIYDNINQDLENEKYNEYKRKIENELDDESFNYKRVD